MNTYLRRAARSGEKTLQAGLDAGVTIAARTPSFMKAGLNPKGADAREVKVAVAEKVKASWDGALSAQRKLGDLWLRAAFGRLTPTAAATAWIDVCDAALRPARARVKANAKRLTR